MNLLRRIAWLLVLLGLTALAMIALTLSTDLGLRLALQASARFVPDGLSYQRIAGRLTGPLQLAGLSYAKDGIDVSVAQAELEWQPEALASGTLVADRLYVRGVTLKLPPAGDKPDGEPFELNDIELPLALQVGEAVVEDLTIYPAGDGQPITIERAVMSAEASAGTVRLNRFELKSGDIELTLGGAVELRNDFPLALDLNWRYRHPKLGPFTGVGRLTGELDGDLELRHDMTGALDATVTGRLGGVLRQPTWTAAIELGAEDLAPFGPELAGSRLSGRLRSSGSLDDFELVGDLASNLPELGKVTATLESRGNTQALAVELLELKASDSPLALELTADIDLAARSLTASGHWRELAWPLVGKAQIASGQGRFAVDGDLNAYRGSLDTAVFVENFGLVDLSLVASGDARALVLERLTAHVAGGDGALDISGNLRFTDLQGELKASWSKLGWPLTGQPTVISPSGNIDLDGSPASYRLRLDGGLDGPQLRPLQATVEATGDQQRLLLEALSLRDAAGEATLDASGSLDLSSLDFRLRGAWQGLVWPLAGGEPQVASPKGGFEASGNVKDYSARLDAEVGGRDLPQGEWRVRAQGSERALDSIELEGDTLGGQLTLRGNAAWQPRLSWQLGVEGITLNPGLHWPEVPANLSFELHSDGVVGGLQDSPGDDLSSALLGSSGPRTASLWLKRLDGELDGQPVAGNAAVALSDNTVTVDALSLSAGAAELRANGRLGEIWALDWRVKVPSLADLSPLIKGSIDGRGTLSGTFEQPQIDGTVTVEELDLGEAGVKLNRLQGEIAVDLSGQRESSVVIKSRGLEVTGQRWETLGIEGGGHPDRHRLAVDASGPLGRFAAAFDGGYSDGTWVGRINRLGANDTLVGDWKMQQAVALTVSQAEASLEQLCLANAPAAVCLNGQWRRDGTSEGTLDLRKLSLASLGRVAPPGMSLTNSLQGKLVGSLTAAGEVNADYELNLGGGDLTVERSEQPLSIRIDGGTLNGKASGDTVDALLSLDLGALGGLEGRLNIADVTAARTLDGTLDARVDSLQLVSELVPQLQEVKGRIDVKLRLSGALPVPLVQGEIKLLDGAVDVPEAGIALRNLEAVVSGDGSGPLQVTGSASSGPGQLNLVGQIDPFQQTMALSASGDQFQIIDAYNVDAVISPELKIVASGTDSRRVEVNGTLLIPRAEIGAPDGAASAVARSGDVVIVDQEGSAADEQSGTAVEVFAKVRVELGEDVKVQVAGFDGQLQGALVIEQTPQLAPRASGAIEVVAGEYRIYGQSLSVERGRAVYSGGPIDNPGLDLRVSRSYGETTAGAQVRGTLRNPTLDLFSDPAMADSGVLSYIAFGKDPADASQSENVLLQQAASALGAGGLSSTLTDSLGLDDLGVETGADGGSAALTVGKYLSPDLYVSYGLGLFDAVNTFNMRYKISDRLRLESSVGTNTSADLLYSVER